MTTLLDVTIREARGGLSPHIGLPEAYSLAEGLVAVGVDVIEVGYFRPWLWGEVPGPGSCPPDYLRRLREILGGTRLSVLAHLHLLPEGALERARELNVDLVRLGVVKGKEGELRRRSAELRSSGVSFAVNALRMTERSPASLVELARIAEGEGASVFYLADSNGGLLPSTMATLGAELRRATRLELGVHLHDNLSLAFANALTAEEHGFTWFDGTIAGIGKGGGNLPSERLAVHLIAQHGRRFDLRTLAALCARWAGGRDPSAALWSAVHGTLNLNQDQASALLECPEQERLERYTAELRRVRGSDVR